VISKFLYFTHLQTVSMDLDLTEEDQMLRAIAMSLGEKIMADCDRKDATKHKQTKEVCSAVLCFSIVYHIYE
jgi:hypothetical protein